MTNYEWLLQMSGEERQAWFDAPHADCEQVDSGANISGDTRTLIIADVNAWIESNVGFSMWASDLREHVIGWLDRQAAITRLECMGGFDGFLEARVQERTAELQAQVDELKHERDYWKLHTDLWAEKCKEAERERELYRARVSDLLDAIQEAWRIGQLEYTLVDMDGEVVS